jgi:hypothetical protein
MISKIINILNIANTKSNSRTFPQIEKLVSLNYESPQKVVLAALSLKIHDSSCDTRYHQISYGAKYCLRSIETKTTQWGSSFGYFSTSCPGTLSNALRHKEPYDLNYSRVWKSDECKKCFIEIFQMMNEQPQLSMDMLVYMLQLYKDIQIQHATLASTTIDSKIDLYTLLCNLCTQTYNQSSLIPVYVVHTYFTTIGANGLLKLKSHNSPDIKGKSYGDVEIHDENRITIIEIKHALEINNNFLDTMMRKTKILNSKNYILTSLLYQRYMYSPNHDIVVWNVASFVHYNLYNTNEEILYIENLYKTLMNSHLDIKVKEKIKNCFHF